MLDLRVGDQVRSVIRLTRTASGDVSPEILYARARGRKKTSAFLKPVQKVVTRVAKAQEASAAKYLSQHSKSSRKRRNGWFVDLSSNLARAGRAGEKALKVRRLVLG